MHARGKRSNAVLRQNAAILLTGNFCIANESSMKEQQYVLLVELVKLDVFHFD